MSKSNNDKNSFLIVAIAVVIIGGMAAFGYQMYVHNNRVIEQFTSIDIPDYEDSFGEWVKNTGSNSCPNLVEQRFDANKSHYMCMYLR